VVFTENRSNSRPIADKDQNNDRARKSFIFGSDRQWQVVA